MRPKSFGTFEKWAPYHVTGSNYRFKVMWIWITFVIVSRLTSPADLVIALLVRDYAWLRFYFHRMIPTKTVLSPQTLKVLRSVKLAPVTSNDSQTEKRTLQQWPGQQSSPLTTLDLSQPLLRVVWRTYFTEGDILSRTTPLMTQAMIRPASFSSLSKVRLKSSCPCSSRFACHFDALVKTVLKCSGSFFLT